MGALMSSAGLRYLLKGFQASMANRRYCCQRNTPRFRAPRHAGAVTVVTGHVCGGGLARSGHMTAPTQTSRNTRMELTSRIVWRENLVQFEYPDISLYVSV